MFLVGGWSDSYVDAAVRMQERCVGSARRTLIGNWVHSFPDDAYPGPAVDWLHELVRFFDHHLNGVDNGWADGPAMTWYERTWAVPERFPEAWPGRWRASDAVPVRGSSPLTLHLGVGSLERAAPASGGVGAGGPPGDRRDVGWALLGRGLAAQWARGGPAPGRGARDHLHLGAARRGDVDRRLSGGRPARGLDDAGRDLRRAVVRGGARRRLRARLDRRAQPDPPAVRRGPGADAGRSRRSSRGGADPAARDRVSVHARPPDPADRPDELLAGTLALADARRAAGPSRSGLAVTARAAGPARRRADARGAVVRASGRGRPRGRCRRRRRAASGGRRRIRRPGRSP